MLGHDARPRQGPRRANGDRARPECGLGVDDIGGSEAAHVGPNEPFRKRHPDPGAGRRLGHRIPTLQSQTGHAAIFGARRLETRLPEGRRRQGPKTSHLGEGDADASAGSRQGHSLVLEEDAVPADDPVSDTRTEASGRVVRSPASSGLGHT